MTNIDAAIRATRPKRSVTWPILIPAVLVLLIWVFFAGANPPDSALQLLREDQQGSAAGYWGYTLGHAIPQALLMAGVVAAAVYFLVLRRRNPDAGLRYWLIMSLIAAVALTAANGLSGYGRVRQERVAQLEKYGAGLLAGMEGDKRALELTLQELEWSKLLDPDLLARKGGLAAARQKITTARTASTDFFSRIEAAQGRMKAEIDRQPISSAEKAEAVAAMDQAFRDTGAPEAIALQGASLQELDKLIGFLEARRSHWAAQGGKFMFDNQKDLDQLTAHLTRLDGHSARLLALQQQNQRQRAERDSKSGAAAS